MAPLNNRRNYPLLLASQFMSAFGDNFILTLILGPLLNRFKAGTITAEEQSVANIYFTSLLFIPYVLLAPLAGYLNDRYSKNRWLLGGNLIKLLGTGMVAAGVTHGSFWQSAGYLVVGVGGAVYSPAKYGILPEILPTARLVKANGLMELLTLVAILTGNIFGSAAFGAWPLEVCYGVTLGVYGLSLALNALMSRTPSYPEIRLGDSIGQFFSNVSDLFSETRMARILSGTALFWVCGAIMKMNFQPWGQQVLRMESMLQISLLGLWLSVGVMVGSVLAGQFHAVGDLRGTRRYGWMLAGGVALLAGVGTMIDHGLGRPNLVAALFLILTGLVAGLFLIPLNAALQAESHKDKLGKTISTQNGFENFAMLCGSLLAFVDVKLGLNPSKLFLALAVFAAIVVVFLKIPARRAVEHANVG